ncbi:MAG: T9SS type A sorting domain-containing protein [Bacteroidia bacterium]|nr:T9SS type A sorting domain-containing protein [Bacteroidia bacterium]
MGKLPSSSLKVYPNPANHKVTIDASGLGKIQSIKLYDSQGKLVENTQTTNNSLVHLEWTATNGMLWVVVTTNKGAYRTKVVSIQ